MYLICHFLSYSILYWPKTRSTSSTFPPGSDMYNSSVKISIGLFNLRKWTYFNNLENDFILETSPESRITFKRVLVHCPIRHRTNRQNLMYWNLIKIILRFSIMNTTYHYRSQHVLDEAFWRRSPTPYTVTVSLQPTNITQSKIQSF